MTDPSNVTDLPDRDPGIQDTARHDPVPVHLVRRDVDLRALAAAADDRAPRRRGGMLALITAGLVVASSVDVGLVRPVFDIVLQQSELVSLLCAVGFVVMMGTTAFTGGVLERLGHRRAAIAAASASVAVITSLALVRVLGARMTVGSTGFDSSSSSVTSSSDLLMAPVMALFMLATATAACIDGWHTTTPAEVAALRTVQRLRDRSAARAGVLRAQVARLTEDLEQAIHQLRSVDADAQDALAALDAQTAVFQEYARTRIAGHLGDPVATSGLHWAAGATLPSTPDSGTRTVPATSAPTIITGTTTTSTNDE